MSERSRWPFTDTPPVKREFDSVRDSARKAPEMTETVQPGRLYVPPPRPSWAANGAAGLVTPKRDQNTNLQDQSRMKSMLNDKEHKAPVYMKRDFDKNKDRGPER